MRPLPAAPQAQFRVEESARAPPPLRAASLAAGDGDCACPAPPAGAAWSQPEASAVIVESRPLPSLVLALQHMADTLPQSWLLVLVGRRAMRGWAATEFAPLLASGRLHYWEMAGDSFALSRVCPSSGCVAARVAPAVLAPSAPSGAGAAWPQDYSLANVVQVRPELYLAIPSETYLVFQTDGMLCAPLNASALREYFRYDYVGAPWGFFPRQGGVGGNGGLSLRSRAAMQRVIAELAYDGRYEDRWLGAGVAQLGGRLPSYEAARAFSVETMPAPAPPLGFHKAWAYLSPAEWAALREHCPIAMRAFIANSAPDNVVATAAAAAALCALLVARLAAGAWLRTLEAADADGCAAATPA